VKPETKQLLIHISSHSSILQNKPAVLLLFYLQISDSITCVLYIHKTFCLFGL